MRLTSSVSNKIANMGFVCILLVMLGHVKWHAIGGAWIDFGRVVHSVSRAIVPFFFVVSGYFLARHLDEDGWWRRAVIKRIGTLLVPFLAWTVLYLFEMFAIDVVLNLQAGRGIFSDLRGVWGNARAFFGLSPFILPALEPCWYVRNLFLLVLVSPVLLWFVRRFGIYWLFALGAVYILELYAYCTGGLLFAHGLGAVLSVCFTMEGVLYFSIGAYCAQAEVDVPRKIWMSTPFVVTAYLTASLLILLPCLFPTTVQWTYFAEGVSMPILAFAIFCSVSGRTWPAWIARSAFPMYLMHPLLFELGDGVAQMVGLNVRGLPYNVLLFVAAVGLALAVTNLIHRYCRPAVGVLFGGR